MISSKKVVTTEIRIKLMGNYTPKHIHIHMCLCVCVCVCVCTHIHRERQREREKNRKKEILETKI